MSDREWHAWQFLTVFALAVGVSTRWLALATQMFVCLGVLVLMATLIAWHNGQERKNGASA